MFHMIGACEGTLKFRKSSCPWIDFKIEKKFEETFYLFNTIFERRNCLLKDNLTLNLIKVLRACDWNLMSKLHKKSV